MLQKKFQQEKIYISCLILATIIQFSEGLAAAGWVSRILSSIFNIYCLVSQTLFDPSNLYIVLAVVGSYANKNNSAFTYYLKFNFILLSWNCLSHNKCFSE